MTERPRRHRQGHGMTPTWPFPSFPRPLPPPAPADAPKPRRAPRKPRQGPTPGAPDAPF